MPSEVSITTPIRFTGSGPKSEAYLPSSPEAVLISAILSTELPRPPLMFSTATITAEMPTSIITPWIKSERAVAL